MSVTIAPGDRVRIHYTSRSLEGSVIETSDHRGAFEFLVGSDEVIPALNQGLVGLKVGDVRTITAPPERAYGRHIADLIQSVPASVLPEGVQVGDQLTALVANRRLDVWVQRLSAKEAVVDANHPLAGETIVIDVKVVGHEPAA
jgi:FKBP-type peptidyl-prolyl cis-trans isomerase 2